MYPDEIFSYTQAGNNAMRNACKESKTQDLDVSATIIAAAALVELAEDSPSNRKIESKQSRKLKGRVKSRFLMKLMHVLDCPEYASIISWTADGKSFSINNPIDLVDTVLHYHFKVTKYDSFIRKLHRWGFRKILRGMNFGCFCNEFFQRGRPQLCKKLVKPNGIALPDFSTDTNDVESTMEKMLENEDNTNILQDPNFHTNRVSSTADNTRSPLQHYNPCLADVISPCQDVHANSSNEVPNIPSSYLSRRLGNSSLHKKIIGDALLSLMIENARQNGISVESHQTLTHKLAVRAPDMNNVDALSTMILSNVDMPPEHYGFN